MDKESLELQIHWADSRIKRINEEMEKFKLERKKLDKLIENDETEIAQLQEESKKNTDEYLSDKPYEEITYFIKERGYTYSVEDVLEGYKKHANGYYNGYTMDDCIKNLKRTLELIFIKA
jgi:predicted RNase H-like nuclease (RuvC/YqgF family)